MNPKELLELIEPFNEKDCKTDGNRFVYPVITPTTEDAHRIITKFLFKLSEDIERMGLVKGEDFLLGGMEFNKKEWEYEGD